MRHSQRPRSHGPVAAYTRYMEMEEAGGPGAGISVDEIKDSKAESQANPMDVEMGAAKGKGNAK